MHVVWTISELELMSFGELDALFNALEVRLSNSHTDAENRSKILISLNNIRLIRYRKPTQLCLAV